MNTTSGNVFYCPWCKITFSKVNSEGIAICPFCGRGRDDGFNQIGENHFQCLLCGCKFLNIFEGKLSCPNKCKFQQGELR